MCSLGRYSPPFGIELLRGADKEDVARSAASFSVRRSGAEKLGCPLARLALNAGRNGLNTTSWSQTHEISNDR